MLKIYYDGKLLEFTDDEEEYMYLDEGAEGIVYRYGKDALKIYKDTCFRGRLDEEQCKKLGVISTKRILLPKGVIYSGDSKTFVGYATPFIYKYPCKRIMDMTVDRLVDEIGVIEDDLHVLADNGVEIDDLHAGNILYNGQIFIGDPGAMIFRNDFYSDWSFKNSRFTFNRFLKDDLFLYAKLTKKEKRNLENRFDDFESYGLQIRDTMNSGETVKRYIKRMTR